VDNCFKNVPAPAGCCWKLYLQKKFLPSPMWAECNNAEIFCDCRPLYCSDVYLFAESESGTGVGQWKSQRDVIHCGVIGAGKQVRCRDDVIVGVRRLISTILVRQLRVRSSKHQLESFLSNYELKTNINIDKYAQLIRPHLLMT